MPLWVIATICGANWMPQDPGIIHMMTSCAMFHNHGVNLRF